MSIFKLACVSTINNEQVYKRASFDNKKNTFVKFIKNQMEMRVFSK